MPAFNDGKYISFAINSVLAQTFKDWELIVVDDGSSDNSADIAKEYAAQDTRITVLIQENQGTVAARNNAIKLAKGEYILPLDADDRLLPKCVETLYNKIVSSKYSVVAPSAASFGLKNAFDDRFRPSRFNMCLRNTIVNSSMYRKSDWERYGGYDPDFKEGIEDYAFWMNFVKEGKKICRVPECLFYFRIKDNNESRQKRADKINYKLTGLILKKYPMMKLARRLHCLLGFKRTAKFNILRFIRIPIFAVPRINLKNSLASHRRAHEQEE
jgi:glycosyltransferase involved in cell wall biosynthesis